jgi:uncharacterized Ntn-hydrolase superfamily protein
VTFSVTGRCLTTGRFGVAISSSSPAVAARCAHARAGVGAACTQNVTDPRLGPALLDAIAGGASATDALSSLTGGLVGSRPPSIEWRQLAVIAGTGAPAAYSGARGLGTHGSAFGPDVVVAGNLLAGADVLDAAVDGFGTDTTVTLADRLLAALDAARQAGGEAGPVHSAGLLVVADVAWPVIDLRVDWTDADPVTALTELWRRFAPEEAAYRQRALDPDAAPGYGVAGDDRPTLPP